MSDKICAIDIGSNTFLCLITEVKDGAIINVILDEVRTVRLGQDLNLNKNFHPEALQRADLTIKEFYNFIEKFKPQKIKAVATAAARKAQNQGELLKIFARYNIPVEIISGEREAKMTYLGALSGVKSKGDCLVIDIGGGSTELIIGTEKKIQQSTSIQLGGVNLKEQFNSVELLSKEAINNVEEYINQQFSLVLGDFCNQKIQNVIAVAGTPTEIGSYFLGGFDKAKLENFEITINMLSNFIDLMFKHTTEERIYKLKINPGRADILPYAALILRKIMHKMNLQSIKVGTKGLRYGLVEELIEK